VVAKARAAKQFLERCVKGDFPDDVPIAYFAARAYFGLPPKPAGEPAVMLAAVTTEMALGDAAAATHSRRTRNRMVEAHATPTDRNAETQLGLFVEPSVRTDATTPVENRMSL
jgi:hypothetical protein